MPALCRYQVIDAAFARVRIVRMGSLGVLCALLACMLCGQAPKRPVATLLDDPGLPGYSAAESRAVEGLLSEAGYAVELETPDEVARGAARITLLAIPQAAELPLEVETAAERVSADGGAVFALGVPAWRRVLVRGRDGAWIDRTAIVAARVLAPPDHALASLASGTLSGWRQHPEHVGRDGVFRSVRVRFHGTAIDALTGVVRVDGGLNTFGPVRLRAAALPGDDSVTVFSAKSADGRVHGFAFYWYERDGSVWQASVSIGPSWRAYRLPASAFHPFFADTPAQMRRGFRPRDVVRFAVAVPFFSRGDAPGTQAFSVAQIGTARYDAALDAPIVPRDLLTPAYKFFISHPPLVLRDDTGARLPLPSGGVLSTYPRPDGAGYAKGRTWRQIAIVTSYDARSGDWRGSPVNLHITTGGATWLTSTIGDPAFYGRPAVRAAFVRALRRIAGGAFILDGGTSRFTIFPGEPVWLGERVANLSNAVRAVVARVTVTSNHGSVLFSHEWRVRVQPHGVAAVEQPWTPPARAPRDGYAVRAELRAAGEPVDAVAHRLYVWAPPAHPHFVTIGADGHFHFEGHVWRVDGVNYAPSSMMATEDAPYFDDYLSAQAYDQAVTDRDLAHVERAGLNEITAWVSTREAASGNLLDLLRSAAAHHLHVNLALRPGMPDDWNWPAEKRLIEQYRLARNDTVFAYGVAWEPGFGKHVDRVALDPAWRRWILAHYGSVANAERAWHFAAPRDALGDVTNPSDVEISTDGGPWTAMVAAYRHFADDWLAASYGAVRNELHSVDPHHAVGFRMAWAGDPTDDGATNMPYQFEGLARGVDVLEPEGYGRVGGSAQVAPGRFEIAYARVVAPRQPVFWAEVGTSVWDPATQTSSPSSLEAQAAFYRRFYEMVRTSGADGVVFWWFPGGYRYNEGSDMGIVNPDGTDRPVTRVIRAESALLRNAPFPPPPNVWLTFDRDKYASGVYGVYHALAPRYWRAIHAGKRPGLRSVR